MPLDGTDVGERKHTAAAHSIYLSITERVPKTCARQHAASRLAPHPGAHHQQVGILCAMGRQTTAQSTSNRRCSPSLSTAPLSTAAHSLPPAARCAMLHAASQVSRLLCRSSSDAFGGGPGNDSTSPTKTA